MALFASFSFVYFLMGWEGNCKHHVMAWEYITGRKSTGFRNGVLLGFGLLLLLSLLPSLVVACVATTRCWLDSVQAERCLFVDFVLYGVAGLFLLLFGC